MANFFRSSVTSFAQTLLGNESGLITAAGGVWVDAAPAITATTGSNQVVNDGYVYSYGALGPTMDIDGISFDLLNGETGLISGARPSGGVIDFDVSSAADIVNHGTIHTPDSDAIDFSHSDGGAVFSLTNTGQISASSSNAVDASLGTSYFYIVNSGQISARGRTMDLDADAVNSSYSVLINSGEITSFEGRAVDAAIGDTGTFKIINSGLISAEAEAIFSSTVRTTTVSLNNTGILETKTDGRAVQFGGGNDNFNNAGSVIGDVDLNVGNDTFNGRDGTVTGLVLGGDGDDRLIGGDGDDSLYGESDNDVLRGLDGEDELSGEAGDDTIDGGADDDMIFGGLGNDMLYGGSGNDLVNGGLNNDSVKAGTGDDTVIGGDGNDTVNGQAGNDMLIGDSGSDVIYGGRGDDTLEGGGRGDTLDGGVGDDVLTGGGAGDTFVIRRVNNGDDIVTDFQNGSDVVDISDLGILNFSRISSAGALDQTTDGVVIDLELLGGSGSITLNGVQIGDMNGTDFIF